MVAKENKVVIVAGGTGGHVMPALAVAKQLREHQVEVHWLGTQAGIEAKLVPQAGIPISYIHIQGLRRTHWYSWLMAPLKILKAIAQSVQVLKRERPASVLSMGGYVAGPAGIAAWLLRIPLVIHEQNAIPGFTNKILSRFAQKIMVAFPNVLNQLGNKVQQAGNPIRQELLAIAEPQIRFQNRIKPKLTLLILGGSQGAKVLNEMVPQAIALLSAELRPEIIHQTGTVHQAQTLATYAQLGLQANVVDFISDMKSAYEHADIIIARSGALTVAEIAMVGLPAIFIPFPYAVDNHQKFNAEYLSKQNAAVLLEQSTLSPELLAQKLTDLINAPEKRLALAMACRRLAQPAATALVASQCLEVRREY